MSYIRPSFHESLFSTFFTLQSELPMYYLNVVRTARNIFITMERPELAIQMMDMIKKEIEDPLKSDFISIMQAFYNPRFMYSKQAYTKVGDSIDYKEVTRYEIMMRLEDVKDWIYDRVVELSAEVRFTRTREIVA